ncbi:MAG: alpha/beta fold hydrolase, partial [Woeseiaceae bacterium]
MTGKLRAGLGGVTTLSGLLLTGAMAAPVEHQVVSMLDEPRPYHVVSDAVFETLGWDLPDAGLTVKRLADSAPGGAFDPRALESIPPETLGYRASWHEVRFEVYGVDWDIGGLLLEPEKPVAGLPTMVIVNGGAANWYEFFVDPLNRAGLGQYLAQKIPVLLVTIPGNYRHGGWTGTDFGERVPAYLLDRDLSREEAAVRNAVYTFRVVAEGIARVVEATVPGPAVIVGHSTGGEVQFLLKERLAEKLGGLSLGWGTGGPAGLDAMREFRGARSIDDYPHVSRLRPRTPEQYAGGYLGPLNPLWDAALSRDQMAKAWMGREQHRRPQFKQPLQDFEHQGAAYLEEDVASQIRETLEGNAHG